MPTLEELRLDAEAAEQKHEDLKSATKDAHQEARDARRLYNLVAIEDAGYEINQIFEASGRWEWDERRNVALLDASSNTIGDVVVKEVTKADKIHQGRRMYAVPIRDLKPLGRTVVE